MTKDSTETGDYEFDFSAWPFYWLARAERGYLQTLALALTAHDLDIPSWRVLSQLHQKDQATVSDLAYHAIVKLPTMTKIVQRMQRAGLVSCQPSPEDLRATLVRLTPKGEVAGRKAWEEADRISRSVFRAFTPREQATLTKLLRRMAEKLDD